MNRSNDLEVIYQRNSDDSITFYPDVLMAESSKAHPSYIWIITSCEVARTNYDFLEICHEGTDRMFKYSNNCVMYTTRSGFRYVYEKL